MDWPSSRWYTRAMTGEPPSDRRDSLDQLMPVVYEHLRLIARRQLAIRERGATLSTTGLVHEAYLKLANQSSVAWSDGAPRAEARRWLAPSHARQRPGRGGRSAGGAAGSQRGRRPTRRSGAAVG